MKRNSVVCKTGGFVISLAGRDRGRIFLVTEAGEDGYVTLADGALRKLEKPKKKKSRHVRPLCGIPESGRLPDGNRALKALVKEAERLYKAELTDCGTNDNVS